LFYVDPISEIFLLVFVALVSVRGVGRGPRPIFLPFVFLLRTRGAAQSFCFRTLVLALGFSVGDYVHRSIFSLLHQERYPVQLSFSCATAVSSLPVSATKGFSRSLVSLRGPVFSSKSFWALVTSSARLTMSPRLSLQSGGISRVRCGHRLMLVDLSPSRSVSRLPFWISGFSYFLSPEFTGPELAPSPVPVGASRSFRNPVLASGVRPGSFSVGPGQTRVSHNASMFLALRF
jgi:hypothetical protein